jgi:hypothetical protein
MDYSKVDADELEEGMHLRQQTGILEVLPSITRISCRYCPDPIVWVNLQGGLLHSEADLLTIFLQITLKRSNWSHIVVIYGESWQIGTIWRMQRTK